MLSNVLKAGGSEPREPQDHGWCMDEVFRILMDIFGK
jgi:hypothetical protein